MSNEEYLKIYSDGGSRGNPGYSASAFVVIDNSKIIYKEAKYFGIKTNNEAEYLGVLMAINWLKKNPSLALKNINYYMDSELVVKQLAKIYKLKSGNLKKLNSKITDLIKKLNLKINFYSIPRELNKIADKLVNIKIDENINKFHVTKSS